MYIVGQPNKEGFTVKPSHLKIGDREKNEDWVSNVN